MTSCVDRRIVFLSISYRLEPVQHYLILAIHFCINTSGRMLCRYCTLLRVMVFGRLRVESAH